MNAWSHLPNASHIDRILADLKANPAKWKAAWVAAHKVAWGAARYAARNAAQDAAWVADCAAREAAVGAAREAAWDATRVAAQDAAWEAAQGVAWEAIAALIAWDDCAHLLDSEPDEVKLLARLGVNAAILIYPACMALNKELA